MPPARPLRRGHPGVRAAVRPPLLAARPGSADRRDPGPGPAHRGERAAHHGPRARAALRQLPSRAQPRCVVPAAGARILLGLLLDAFAPRGPVVMALDDTIERRWGRRIRARGIYRDPVRSSDAHFVKTSGLRWMSLMLLAPIPWAGRVWALPFLTALAPSERSCREQGRRHKTAARLGRQLALQARRWLPGRDLVLVADSGFSALLFLDAMRRGGVTTITRLRLDAALYEPAPPRPPGTIGRPRTKGARLPTLSEVLADESTLLADGRRAGLVRGGRAHDRDRLGHRGLAARRPAGRADPLGADPRSREPLRTSGAALHRPRARPGADRGLVRAALAGRGHLPGGPRPSRRGDAAAVVRQGRSPAPRPACSRCSRS